MQNSLNPDVMCRQCFYLIGLSDDRQCFLPPEVTRLIATQRLFSGGRRHHEIVQERLPEGSRWIDITVPLEQVFAQYEGCPEVVVFASGDPLFFGFANTLRQRLPEAEIRVYPCFNSLQTLAHRMLLSYAGMRCVSLTGRPWDELDRALIEQTPLMGLLTDRHKTPDRIAARLLEYGYANYRMTVGELLGNRDRERVSTYTLEEAAGQTFEQPNCLILEQTARRPRPFGIPDSAFHLLNGRSRMITKASIRLLSLQMLELRERRVFWDIGFCTGSVSIEARLQFPHLHIEAFEQRPEGEELMRLNSRRFGTPGIGCHIGDFLQADLSGLERPDAVFIGGHGGQLPAMLQRLHPLLQPGGVLVFNSVSEESLRLFLEGVAAVGRRVTSRQHVVIDSYNPIEILKAE